MIEQVNKLSQRLVVEPANRDAILCEIATAMKTSRHDAEEIMSGYLRQTGEKGHPEGFYVWMGKKMREAQRATSKKTPTPKKMPPPPRPGNVEEAAVAKYYGDSGGTTLKVRHVDEKARTITLGTRRDSVTYEYSWSERAQRFWFKVVEIKVRGATVLQRVS